MENKKFELKFYNEAEIQKIIKSKEQLYYVDDGIDEAIIRLKDIPDFIVDINRKQGMVDLKFYKVGGGSFEPVITTMGEYLNKVKPVIREKIIDRLVKLQIGEIEPKKYKIIDEDVFENVKNKMEKEIKHKDKIVITIADIENRLCDLDTEYRESLATALVELKYISDTPLKLEYGTEEQQVELEKAWTKPLKSKQIKEIIEYISNEMKGDFQYGQFKNIVSDYISISNTMKKMEEKQRSKER